MSDNADPDPSELIRILVATDNHLGFGMKYPERKMDSFITFDEILQIGKDHGVDLVILGGDLFHDNKPLREVIQECMKILKKHVFGDRPVAVELVSDPQVNFAHMKDENHRMVNYMDPNLNIALPIFSIHGNHDDPCGQGGYCSLDTLHTAGLVNHFGRIDNIEGITVNPLLFKKGDQKFALYGMSSVKDDRLQRLFRQNQVKMLQPEEDTDSWFNLLVLHQNRAKRSVTGRNHIPEHFIDGMFDLVIWGHEHDCRLTPEESYHGEDKSIFISQPGSSVATSLCEGEAMDKKVGILSIHGKNFKMDEIPLKTVRPMIFKTINLTEENPPDLKKAKNEKELQLKMEKFLVNYIENLLKKELPKKLTGHPDQPTLPLVRIRVEYEDENHVISVGRFGNNFLSRVANPPEMLLFKKVKRYDNSRAGGSTTIDNTGSATIDIDDDDLVTASLADMVYEHLKNEAVMEALGPKGLSSALQHFYEKGDKNALPFMVEKQMAKIGQEMNALGIDNFDEYEETLKEITSRKKSAQQEDQEVKEIMSESRPEFQAEDKKIIQESDDDLMQNEVENQPPPAKRGRGRGRGSRGAGRGSRGRGVSSPAKKPALVTSSTPSSRTTIMDAFARQSQVSAISQRPSRNASLASQRKAKQIYDDSDSD